MEIYNTLVTGKEPGRETVLSILVLFAGGMIAFALASYLFSWDSQNNNPASWHMAGNICCHTVHRWNDFTLIL